MNKEDNKLAWSVIAVLISGIALIYTLIIYHHIMFAVMGMSLIFLICAYILTQNIIAFSVTKNAAANEQLKDYISDIGKQLDSMNGIQTKLSKATFLYTKQAAQAVAMLENNYVEGQEVLYRNLSTISNAQNKATKLMIKFDQSNTTKVISTLKELRNQISDTMIQGFDQIQPDNQEVIEALEDIVNYLKSQPAIPDHDLSLQLNNVAHELQNISSSIQQFQIPAYPIERPVTDQENTFADEIITATNTMAVTSNAINQESKDLPEYNHETEMIPEVPEQVETPIDAFDEISQTDMTASSGTETLSDINAVTEKENSPFSEDTNKQLSADEIAALFAAAEPAPKKEKTDTISDSTSSSNEPFTPTFTVIGKSDEYIKEQSRQETESVPTMENFNNPNKQLSADEIAALFAAAEPVPKKEEKKEKEEPQTTPVPIPEDANRQLSADEIAALFAAAEPTPKRDYTEEQLMDEAISKAKPATTASDDPNRQLSADEIAALFASLG